MGNFWSQKYKNTKVSQNLFIRFFWHVMIAIQREVKMKVFFHFSGQLVLTAIYGGVDVPEQDPSVSKTGGRCRI